MMIINETLIGKELDKTGIISNQHAAQYAHTLVKYYQHIGKTNTEIAELLKEKINIQTDIDDVAKDYIYQTTVRNMNYHGKFRDGVLNFSLNELEYIHKLDNIDLEKFMFTLIALYKSFGHAPKLKKIPFMRMAMLSARSSYFDDCAYQLHELHYINIRENKRKSKNDTIYELVYDVYEDFPQYDETQKCLTIHDTNIPVLFYYMYYGLCDIQFCEDCGEPYIQKRKRKDKHTYCSKCSKQRKKEYDKQYASKRRGLKKVVDYIP